MSAIDSLTDNRKSIMTQNPNPLTPLDPIEIHYYYACSWVINHHGLNQLQAVADIAESLDIGLRVRQMFTDQYGFVMYPFTIKVPDEKALHEFLKQVGAGIGMEEWYIVNISYYEKGVPFADNLRKVLNEMPLWLDTMRKYADHNATLHDKQKAATPADSEAEAEADSSDD